jgi:prolyl-tRNA synthetase
VAPYQVCITPLSVDPNSEVMKTAVSLYNQLQEKGVEVIFDNRDERPGVKFKDADLIGFPFRIGIGEKSLAKGEIEIKPRGGKVEFVPVNAALEKVLGLVKA